MHTENPARDILLFVKAVLSNQLARFAPTLYVKLTCQTGRGFEAEEAAQVVEYFHQCFFDYRVQIGLNDEEFSRYLKGKSILEYGPGNVLGVALLMFAHGAEQVTCVDRFALTNLSDRNVDIYAQILNSLDPVKQERAKGAFNEWGNPKSGLKSGPIRYEVTKNGLGAAGDFYDLIISRAVLEHVNDLEETMENISLRLKPGGISLHQVDLKSHGLDRYTPLDFLTWPTSIYRLMYSHKGFPNRWRVDKYKQFAHTYDLRLIKLAPIDRIEVEKLKLIQNKLAKEFMHVSVEDLSWLNFWMILEHV